MEPQEEELAQIKSIEDLEARGPKLPPCGYPQSKMKQVWRYLDPQNEGATSMSIILKQENKLKKVSIP